MIEKRRAALVVRGYATKGIRGVKELIDVETLNVVMDVREIVTPINTVIETCSLTDSRIKAYNEERPNVIYIGGTQVMWNRLQGIVECNIERDSAWTYTNFKLQPLIKLPFGMTVRPHWRSKREVNTNPGTIDFMVYEHRTKDGGIVTALYGSSPVGVWAAARRWMNSWFDGTELIIVGEAMKDDLYIVRELYRHEV